MKNAYLALALLIAILCPIVTHASHAQGADLAYRFVSYDSVTGTSQYYVTATEYRDCSGIPADNSLVLTVTNTSCSGGAYTSTLNLPMINGLPCPFGGTSTSSTGCEISHYCLADLSQTTCSGGIYPGMQKYVYGAMLTLPGNTTPGYLCAQWTIGIAISTRNASSNLSTNGNLYIEAVINNTIDPLTGQPYHNSSPVFQNDPVPFACSGAIGLDYNNAGIDADGDSLVYAMVSPLQGHNFPLVFQTGYTVANPIISSVPCQFDRLTGILKFSPSQIDVDALAFLIEEYRHGILVGSTRRDVQIKVLNCYEETAVFGQPVVQGGVLVDSISITSCPGDNLTVDVPISSAGLLNVTLQSSIDQFPALFPNMTFVQSGTGPNVTGRIQWSPVDTVCRYVYIRADVYNCPISAYSFRSFKICGTPKVHISPQSPSYCGQPIVLTGSGGLNPVWSPTTNLSGANNIAAVVNPVVNTWYHLSTSCGSDSVLVRVGALISGSISHDTSVCNGTPVQLMENVMTSGLYTYSWSPATGLYDPITDLPNAHIPNPVAKNGHDIIYHCQVTDTSGCSISDSVRVNAGGAGTLVLTGDTLVPTGGIAHLNATVVSYTTECTTLPAGSVSLRSQVQVGTGTTIQGGSQSLYPSPFGNYCKSARHQLLFRASELQALFGTSRIISQLALDIGVLNNGSTLHQFTVKVGCVHADSLTGYVGGNSLVTAINGISYTPQNGWNTLVFQNAYVWDGVSDLVVDICFLNTTSNNINNKMRYTTTSFRSLWCTYGNDPAGQCGFTGSQQGVPASYYSFFQRPNVKFGLAVDSNNISAFQWQPATGINAVNSPTAYSTYANVSSDQWYIATLADSVCPQTDSILVRVINSPTHTPFHRNLCLGDSIPVAAYGASSYTWSDGTGVLSTNSGFTYAPTQNSTLTLVMTDGGGNTFRDTSYVTVLGQRVWPGDVDDDRIVDYGDLLYVGIAFGDTGSVRPNASQVWVEQCATSWDSAFAISTNCVHADCNGDGIVGYDDTLAVVNNMGQTHPKTTSGRSSNYSLAITTDRSLYSIGDTIIASISAGDANNPLSAVYGIAYLFDYTSHGATHILSTDQSISWLNRKLDHRKQATPLREYLVQSRIDHKDTAGYGKIAEIRLKVDGGTSLVDSGYLNVTTLLALDKNGDTVYLNPAAKSVTINGTVGIEGINPDKIIEIYPNPSAGVFRVVHSDPGKVSMVIMDALGREVYERVLTANTTNIDLSILPGGVYLADFFTSSGKSVKRLIIEK